MGSLAVTVIYCSSAAARKSYMDKTLHGFQTGSKPYLESRYRKSSFHDQESIIVWALVNFYTFLWTRETFAPIIYWMTFFLARKMISFEELLHSKNRSYIYLPEKDGELKNYSPKKFLLLIAFISCCHFHTPILHLSLIQECRVVLSSHPV